LLLFLSTFPLVLSLTPFSILLIYHPLLPLNCMRAPISVVLPAEPPLDHLSNFCYLTSPCSWSPFLLLEYHCSLLCFICYRRIVYLHSKSDSKTGAVFCGGLRGILIDTLEVVKHSFIFAILLAWHTTNRMLVLFWRGLRCVGEADAREG